VRHTIVSADAYRASVMRHLPDSLALLGRTPAALDARLRDLPATWIERNEGGHTWSPFEIVGGHSASV
jgi:hypothetical protein